VPDWKDGKIAGLEVPGAPSLLHADPIGQASEITRRRDSTSACLPFAVMAEANRGARNAAPLTAPFQARPGPLGVTSVARAVPNLQLRSWRAGHHLTREEMASRINATQTGVAERLAYDDERIRRWETGKSAGPLRSTGGH
jgi:hypothetical protein